MKIVNLHEVEKAGYVVENNIIERFEINIVAHFGNTVSFEAMCRNCYAFAGYQNIENLGFIIKAVIEFLDLSEEDGLRLSEIKGVPCRVIFENGKAIGFGHFINNKFIYTKDLMTITKESKINE